jgi:hypothetical protein
MLVLFLAKNIGRRRPPFRNNKSPGLAETQSLAYRKRSSTIHPQPLLLERKQSPNIPSQLALSWLIRPSPTTPKKKDQQ